MVNKMREITKVIVHCAATPEGRDVATEEIKRWHTEERGWSDIGYHWVIELDGSTNEGRSEDINGAHCRGHNSDSIGICYVGGSDSEGNPKDTRTEGQRDALVALIKEILDRYPDAEVFGHRDFSTKACPSFDAKTEYAGL
jgi:N-acetylmuramoyl-L-alanine amidase|tara:strand:+ start:2357 stop:2779 length:423 start_codon:yes stop_codon:yes gene_type:complete